MHSPSETHPPTTESHGRSQPGEVEAASDRDSEQREIPISQRVIWDSFVVALTCATVFALANVPSLVPVLDVVLLLALAAQCWLSPIRSRLGIGDTAVIALFILEALCVFRDRSGVALGTVAAAYRGIALYWLVRTVRRADWAARGIGIGVGGAAAMLSLFSMEFIHHWVEAVLGAGFSDVLALKATIPSLLGGLVTEWASILLLCLILQVAAIRISAGWSSISNIAALVAASLTVSALFLTFSRGAYVALALFLVTLLCFGAYRRSRRVVAVAALLTVAAGAGALCMNSLSAGSVAGTAAMHANEQQRRSSRGRLEVWSNVGQLVASNPILGVGPGQFAMRYMPLAKLGDGREFVGRPLNTGLTILIETGVCGLAVYLVIAVSAGCSALRNIRRLRASRAWPAVALLAGVGAFAVREATYSSLIENRTVMALFWIVLGLTSGSFVRRSRAGEQRKSATLPLVAISALLAFAGFVFFSEYRQHRAIELAAQASSAINDGDFEGAVSLATQAIAIAPTPYHFSVRALARASVHVPRFDPQSPAQVAQSAQDRRELLAALADYNRALAGNPDDDLFRHNRAWLRLALGESLAAVRADIDRSMQIDGSVPDYHVALGLMEERAGRRAEAMRAYTVALSVSPEIADSAFAADLKRRDSAMWRMCLANAVARLRDRDPAGRDVANQAALARLFMEQGDLAPARRMFERVTAIMPQFPRPWSNLGYAQIAAGDSQDAELSLRKALFLDGGYCPTRILLARLARKLGDEDAASQLEGRCADGGRVPPSQHARRVQRLYKVTGVITGDDILPLGVSAYCSPLRYQNLP
jgi:tetratricopeptide (TPR) repeat protein